MKPLLHHTTHTHGNLPVRHWHLVDLDGKTLGRATTAIAQLLVGKHLVSYSPHRDDGDYVVVINAASVRVTGKKFTDKVYHRYTGFPGGLRTQSFKELISRHPAKVIELAVKNMLPKNRLRKDRLARLKVFATAVHPYQDKLIKAK